MVPASFQRWQKEGEVTKDATETGRGECHRIDAKEQEYWRNPKGGVTEMAAIVTIADS